MGPLISLIRAFLPLLLPLTNSRSAMGSSPSHETPGTVHTTLVTSRTKSCTGNRCETFVWHGTSIPAAYSGRWRFYQRAVKAQPRSPAVLKTSTNKIERQVVESKSNSTMNKISSKQFEGNSSASYGGIYGLRSLQRIALRSPQKATAQSVFLGGTNPSFG